MGKLRESIAEWYNIDEYQCLNLLLLSDTHLDLDAVPGKAFLSDVFC